MRKSVLALGLTALLITTAAPAEESANIDVRSNLVGTRVYLEDTYVGDADLFLENVPSGDHLIIMRQGSQRINGQFSVKPGETLMLEGRFDENRIVDLKKVAREDALRRAEEERKAEAERKAAEGARELEKKKQQAAAPAPEKKKPEPRKPVIVASKPAKSAQDDRRDQYLTLIRVDFADEGTAVKITSRVNQRSTSNFTESDSTTGKLFRSKQNYVLCEGGDCFRDWTGRFFYTDDRGKRDAFLIRWRETIFTGITPQGTSKKELDLCLNGDCKRLTYTPEGGAMQSSTDRYTVVWGKNSFVVRRTDLLKEITDAGGRVPEF